MTGSTRRINSTRRRRKQDDSNGPKQQDGRICGTICVCQMMMISSCVSFVYLSVAVYWPSHKAFNVPIDAQPVICQTIESVMTKNCSWTSCAEWCLSKPTGLCPQLYVTVRRNGTNVRFHNCTKSITVSCPPANENGLKRYNCNENRLCSNLTGVFKCRLGRCANLSEIYRCIIDSDMIHRLSSPDVVINSTRENLKLNGILNCKNSRCVRIDISQVKCERYCDKIETKSMNIYLKRTNNLLTAAKCFTATMANSPEAVIWSSQQTTPKILFTSCTDVYINTYSLRAMDCINGMLIDERIIPQPYMNFSQFWSIYEDDDNKNKISISAQNEQQNNNNYIDNVIPTEKSLIIYNKSHLLINLDGCVNTLRNECKQFIEQHNKNGSDHTTPSIFNCYHNRNDSTFVLSRWDLNETWLQLMIAVSIPGALFIVSFVTLMIITQTVTVADDATMRCKWCCLDDKISNLNNNAANDGNTMELLSLQPTHETHASNNK